MKGICMKDFLLKQFIAGNKTMTRRTGGLEDVNEDPDTWTYSPLFGYYDRLDMFFCKQQDGRNIGVIAKPRYAKGTTVYIKEGYIPGYFDNGGTAYATDWNSTAAELMPRPKFNNKLFMPATEARYFSIIEDVYPQRLQDITEDDALAEGVLHFSDDFMLSTEWINYLSKGMTCPTAKDSFATLIDSINGKGTWDKNPWVWVYKIKMVDKPLN